MKSSEIATMHQALQAARDAAGESQAKHAAEVAAKKRAFDEWDAPRREYRAAIAQAEAADTAHTASVQRAEGQLRRTFAPFTEPATRRLVAELHRTSSSFRTWAGGSNKEEIEARSATIRTMLARLDSLHLSGVTDPAAAVAEVMDTRLPILAGEL